MARLKSRQAALGKEREGKVSLSEVVANCLSLGAAQWSPSTSSPHREKVEHWKPLLIKTRAIHPNASYAELEQAALIAHSIDHCARLGLLFTSDVNSEAFYAALVKIGLYAYANMQSRHLLHVYPSELPRIDIRYTKLERVPRGDTSTYELVSHTELCTVTSQPVGGGTWNLETLLERGSDTVLRAYGIAIANTIDQQVVEYLREIAPETEKRDPLEAAQEIHRKTLFGAGNWILASPAVVRNLVQNPAYTSTSPPFNSEDSLLTPKGSLNNSIQIWEVPFWTGKGAVIGRKGRAMQVGAALGVYVLVAAALGEAAASSAAPVMEGGFRGRMKLCIVDANYYAKTPVVSWPAPNY
jgi:hypothetical protein